MAFASRLTSARLCRGRKETVSKIEELDLNGRHLLAIVDSVGNL